MTASTARFLLCLAVWGACAPHTRCELPPSVYEQKQKAAPEHLRIEVLRLEIEPGEKPGSQRISMVALVNEVLKTSSKLKPGQIITVAYTVHDRPKGFVGPGEIPILAERSTSVAYLAKDPDRESFTPVAGAMSFNDF